MGLDSPKRPGTQDEVDDKQLLLEAMLCVAFADGDEQYEETNLVRAFAATLPEFKNADTYEVHEKAEKLVKLHGALSREKERSHLSSPALEEQAFLLAMDIALSSGEIDDGEEAVLAGMLMMKYASRIQGRQQRVCCPVAWIEPLSGLEGSQLGSVGQPVTRAGGE